MEEPIVMKTQRSDPVNRPAHYLAASVMIEPIELTARLDSCLGQAVQYVLRAPYKGNEREDLKKAVYYLCKRIDLIKFSAARIQCVFEGEICGFISIFQNELEDDFAQEFLLKLFDRDARGVFVSEVEQASAAVELIQAKLDAMYLKDVRAME